MIPAQPVNAALRWIGEDTFLQTGLANFLRDVLFSREGLAARFVFDEFDAQKQTETANVADMWMGLQRRKHAAELLRG